MDNINNKSSSEALKKVSTQRVLFGHQSVGNNLIDGLSDLAAENPDFKLNIVNMETDIGISGPVFAHFLVGSNTNPESKIASFVNMMTKNGNNYDVALFKFCYVDLNEKSDAAQLFMKYKKTISDLKQKFPNVVFVHVTIPVTRIQSGIKGSVKKVLGKSIGEEVNVVRTRYNDLMRKEYTGREPLYDIAAEESTAPDGSRVKGQKNGVVYEALCPQYASDWGHLNKLGRERCALALLQTLAKVEKSNKAK